METNLQLAVVEHLVSLCIAPLSQQGFEFSPSELVLEVLVYPGQVSASSWQGCFLCSLYNTELDFFVSFIHNFLPIPYGNPVKDKITIHSYSFIMREKNNLAHELTCWANYQTGGYHPCHKCLFGKDDSAMARVDEPVQVMHR